MNDGAGDDATLDSGVPRGDGELAAGSQLGKYKLVRMLGSGGMGVVWAAHDPDLEREVAIKVLRGADAGPALRTRLLREARAMARLKHHNVLTVYEVGSDGDRDYIAMELVDGTSLDRWLAARPPATEVWSAIVDAGRGLAAAHAAGLVHRDFKPHNVLRDRDGRVLVTDFGLARGQHEGEPAPMPAPAIDPAQLALEATAAGSNPRRTDAVLDSTLTQPGQLLGTPAYMAPEQYLGSPPDPRTDQFAFCVTAWQALTGERPFDGKTIDELRQAANRGVAGVKAKMPRGVRPILERGLSPDPDKRWPDLQALLAALARNVRRRNILSAVVWSVCGTIVIASAITGIQLLLHRSDSAPPSAPAAATTSTCQPADEAFADVWSPDRRAALAKRYANSAVFARTADALDGVRTAWTAAYAKTCAAPHSTTAMARLSCLLGERDELATYTRMLETLPPATLEYGQDLWGLLPRVTACEVESPVSPPLLPEDRKARDRIVALRVRLASLRMSAPGELVKQADELRAAARAIGWRPLEGEVDESLGVAAQIAGDLPSARAALERAADLAEQLHDYKHEASARVALYEVEATESAHPDERGRGDRLREQAHAAIRRAGDDPLVALALDMLAAANAAEHLQLDPAIAGYDAACKRFGELGAARQLALCTADVIALRVRRDGPARLDDTWQIGIAAEHELAALARGQVQDRIGPLAPVMVDLAWRRGELADAHARADRIRHPLTPASSIEISGRVTRPDGTPAAGASVIAWHGDLAGDATRAYTRGDFEGDVATADERGVFTLHAPSDGAVVAELGTLRSPPVRVAPAKPLALALADTRVISGLVRSDDLGALTVAVRFDAAPNARWLVAAPVGSGGAFHIGSVPATGGTLLAMREERTVTAGVPREGAVIAWPSGPTIDVIVRAPRGDYDVYALRGHRDIRSRAQLVAAAQGGDVAALSARPIGFVNATELGAHHYQVGDVHALVHDTAPGDITACALPSDEARAPFCATGTAPANGSLAMVVVAK